MAESVERYFRLMLGRRARLCERLWSPAADVYRTLDGWIVKFDLAGVREADIEVTIDGPNVRVTGVRRDSFYGEGVSYHQLEITYSRFERTLRLPCSIESAHLAQKYQDGLLILHLQQKPDDKDCD
jgi:HSP20 family protein